MPRQSIVTESHDGVRRRPIAAVREPRAERLDAEGPKAGAASRSSRASSDQLLRACLIVFVGLLCVAYVQVGSARAAGQAVARPIDKTG